MTQSEQQEFYVRLAQYLRDFYADLSPIEDSGTALERGSTFWSRANEGTLHLTAVGSRNYHQLLWSACEILAPHEDLSEAAIDTALQDAIFSVVDSSSTRTPAVEDRVREAIEQFRRLIDAPRQGYECWIEVAGIDTDSLPAAFGTTRFAVVGHADTERLIDLVRTKHTGDRASRLETTSKLAEQLQDRPIAIQRVNARDARAAQAFATRDVAATIECINCFADVIRLQPLSTAKSPMACLAWFSACSWCWRTMDLSGTARVETTLPLDVRHSPVIEISVGPRVCLISQSTA